MAGTFEMIDQIYVPCLGAMRGRDGLHSWYFELPKKLDMKSVSAPGGAGLGARPCGLLR